MGTNFTIYDSPEISIYEDNGGEKPWPICIQVDGADNIEIDGDTLYFELPQHVIIQLLQDLERQAQSYYRHFIHGGK